MHHCTAVHHCTAERKVITMNEILCLLLEEVVETLSDPTTNQRGCYIP